MGSLDNSQTEIELASADIARKEYAAALRRLDGVLRQEPNFAPAHLAAAHALGSIGRLRDAAVHARRAIALQPGHPTYRLMLARICAWAGRRGEARRLVSPYLQDPPVDPIIRANVLGTLAEIHISAGDFALAEAPLRAALALDPGSTLTQTTLGLNLLQQGQLQAGWREFENQTKPVADPIQRWEGEPLHDRTILIVDDQGYGDAVHFFRYLHQVHELGPNRIFHRTFPLLAPLLARSAPFAQIVTHLPPDVEIDYYALTTSLPRIFGTRLETIPAQMPYLSPPSRRRSQTWLPPTLPLRRIGLVWSGDPRHLRDHVRSIPASLFLTVTEGLDAAFFSLQVNMREADRPALEAYSGIHRIGEALEDYSDTAAVIDQLDLVISVDTSVAHLAGAMAKPVWILLPLSSEWRWFIGREDSPWYPTARLFRADRRGWPPLVTKVKAALKKFLRSTDQAEPDAARLG